MANRLYYGDNYEVLKRYIATDSVDLIYLDPPFNSRKDYNVLFAEKDGSQSSSQIHAFEDTWEWNIDAERSYEYVVEQGGRVAEAMRAFRTFLGGSDMMAYLAMMAPRLVELRRVLKQAGSIYLHCDATASHYLKILMDAIFGPQFFRNEVIWKRRGTVFCPRTSVPLICIAHPAAFPGSGGTARGVTVIVTVEPLGNLERRAADQNLVTHCCDSGCPRRVFIAARSELTSAALV